MKNITLSADGHLIQVARKRAASEKTTLNVKFREWLEDYAQRERQAQEALAFIKEMRKKVRVGGRKFTRDEMNKR